MWNLKKKKMIQMNLPTKQKQTHWFWEWAYSCQREGWGEGIVREFGMDMYTLLYLTWVTDKDLLHSTWNSAQYYVAAWMVGEFGGKWIHEYVWLSHFTVHLKLSQHCLLIGYTPIQNKKFKHILYIYNVFSLSLHVIQVAVTLLTNKKS